IGGTVGGTVDPRFGWTEVPPYGRGRRWRLRFWLLRGRRIPPLAALGGCQRLFLSRQLGQPLLIVEPIVVLLPVDVHAIGDRIGTERMMIPDHDVGVLPHLERSDAVVDAKLL